MNDAVGEITAYHRRTKHHLNRYAAGPDFLDWNDQPEPFRRFAGCNALELAPPGRSVPVAYCELGAVPPEPIHKSALSLLLELSFGLSAWKQYGSDRWALRCNPSSGNLHPTEAYVVVAGIEGLEDGVYHYVSHDHILERRCCFKSPAGFSGVFLGLSSIHWREAWKYGERAYRYCQHDAGHALAALRYAAAVLGWSMTLLAECSDPDIESVLGLNRDKDFEGAEHEAPDALCLIHLPGGGVPPDMEALLGAARAGVWSGRANTLSHEHRFAWPVIDQAEAAARKPRTMEEQRCSAKRGLGMERTYKQPAAEIIRRRRSAQRFDGQTILGAAAFYRVLDATLSQDSVPLDMWPWSPRIHLVLFVHRVRGVRPGIYVLPRCPGAIDDLRRSMRADFAWEPVEGCPEEIPLYRLVTADCRRAAMTLSCHQSIASDGAFSLGMLADFEAALSQGAWNYRRLFWEAGAVGQILYLEAEAASVRGTGIGCYFDDAVHEVLGLQDERYQSLYHFTIGTPLEDTRLETLPPYAHLTK